MAGLQSQVRRYRQSIDALSLYYTTCSTKTRIWGSRSEPNTLLVPDDPIEVGLMYAGQLLSEHFLTDGIRSTEAYQRLTTDPTFTPDVRRRLEQVYQQFPFRLRRTRRRPSRI